MYSFISIVRSRRRRGHQGPTRKKTNILTQAADNFGLVRTKSQEFVN